jgi:hypothetical protein
MPQDEIFGTRDRSYSAWHRRNSTRRFVGIELAQTLAMIDLDAALYVEYDDFSKEPLALVETAMDRGQAIKPSTVTRNLARRCTPTVPAYLLLYKLGNEPNPSDPAVRDIVSFRYRRLWPSPEAEKWVTCTPEEWAENLVKLRQWSARIVDKEWAITAYSKFTEARNKFNKIFLEWLQTSPDQDLVDNEIETSQSAMKQMLALNRQPTS